jgi:PadR family transcriptional regulator, regulatory protein PadR
MAAEPRLTEQAIRVIRALLEDPSKPRYGRDIARATQLKSGSLHPILARLEQAGWIESFWEEPTKHEDAGRPRRRYYRFTTDGAQCARLAIAARSNEGAAIAIRLRPQPNS